MTIIRRKNPLGELLAVRWVSRTSKPAATTPKAESAARAKSTPKGDRR